MRDTARGLYCSRFSPEGEEPFPIGIFPENLIQVFPQELRMQTIAGYIGYTRREYCNDVRCPIQLLLNNEAEKSPRYEEIRAICASHCLHSTHEFHHWLTGKGYLVVRPEHK